MIIVKKNFYPIVFMRIYRLVNPKYGAAPGNRARRISRNLLAVRKNGFARRAP